MAHRYSAKVRGGVIVPDDDVVLPEGARVVFVVNDTDADDSFELTPEQEAELDLALAEADREEGVPAAEFLASLQREHGAR